jgi:hypothetical protein
MVSEKEKKEWEERSCEYDEHLEAVIEKLEKAEDAIDEMLEFCSEGEPEFYGSKAMKAFFWNLGSLCHNGRSFLWEMQEEIKFRKDKSN